MEAATHNKPLSIKALTDIADASEQLFYQDNWMDISIRQDMDGIVMFHLDYPAFINTFSPEDCKLVESVIIGPGKILMQFTTNVKGHTFTTHIREDVHERWVERTSHEQTD